MLNHTWKGIPAPPPETVRLTLPSQLISRTVLGLRARSAGRRESACVWTGARNGLVTDVIFHHELADDRATALSLELPEKAKFALYGRLAARGETILALLHTHPEDWVGLSPVDQRNQLGSKIGFWSIVLPYYAANNWRSEEIGFHVRQNRGWSQLTAAHVGEYFHVEGMA